MFFHKRHSRHGESFSHSGKQHFKTSPMQQRDTSFCLSHCQRITDQGQSTPSWPGLREMGVLVRSLGVRAFLLKSSRTVTSCNYKVVKIKVFNFLAQHTDHHHFNVELLPGSDSLFSEHRQEQTSYQFTSTMPKRFPSETSIFPLNINIW